MEEINTSGQAFVDHWQKMANKNEINPHTAGSLRTAVKAVMEVQPDWETMDVRTLDVDTALRRFGHAMANRKNGPSQSSMRIYQRRFRQAHEDFLSYVADPLNWVPSSGRPLRENKRGRDREQGPETTGAVIPPPPAAASPSQPGAVDYPFPLREGFMARLRLPVDLTSADVERLSAFMKALVPATKV